MAVPMFNNPYEWKDNGPEVNSGELITEQAGYISPKEQIEGMIMAGERLAEYRREMFDIGRDEEDDGTFLDPTRAPNYDLVDAQRDAERLKKKLAKKKAQKEKTETEKLVDEAIDETSQTPEKNTPGAATAAPGEVQK